MLSRIVAFLALLAVTSADLAAQGSGPGPARNTAPSPATTPRPVEQFAELPALERPTLSPDGKLIAARAVSNGKLYLAIMPVDGGAPYLVGTGDNDLNWWDWVNDEWLIVGIGGKTVIPLTGEFYVRRAVSVSAVTHKIVTLGESAAQAADDVIWTATDGTPRIRLSVQKSMFLEDSGFYPEVVELDVSNGRSKRILAPRDGVFNWVADGSGAVRVAVSRSLDGRDVRVLYRGSDRESFREIARGRTNLTDPIVPRLFLPDGKAVAIADDADGFGALYEYDPNTQDLGKQLYASKGFDLRGVLANQAGNGIAGVLFEEDQSRTQWVEPDLIALQAEVAKQVKGGSANIVSYSRDHGRAIVKVGATNSPGAYFLFLRATAEMMPLGYVNPAIRTARLNKVSTVRYAARDGLPIAAVLTLPRGRSRNLPLIVMPHGGPLARDSEEWDWWSQFMAERGYAVIQPNYRGSSGYGTAFTKKGEGQWGLAMQDDLNDAVAYLAKEGIADPKRVCIVGGSYGGYAAMRAAQRDPGVYRCAVSYAGVSDLVKLRRYDAKFLSAGARADWLKRQATDFRSVSPLTTPEATAIPLLIVHGKKDTVVPVGQSRDMAAALRKAGKPFTYIEQPEADHYFSRQQDRLEFLRALEDFLAKHNPA